MAFIFNDFHFWEDRIVDIDVDFTFVIAFATITIGVHPAYDHFVLIVLSFGIASGPFSCNVSVTSISMDWNKLTNKVSPIVTITCEDYTFVQLQNLDGFAINLEESLWNNMLDKNFPNTKIS